MVKSDGTKISNIEVKKSDDMDRGMVGLTMTLTLARKCDHNDYLLQLNNIEGVYFAEETI